MKKELPVFIFNGFLDSGKTTLMKEILSSDETYHNGKTVIICTEEGIESFPAEWLNMYHLNLVVMLDEEKLTKDFLESVVKKYKAEMLFMEINAFFDFNNMEMPEYFQIYQQVTTIDAKTFEVYYNNMKQLFNNMAKYSSIIVFNRCDGVTNLGNYRRMIRAFNQQGQVGFETSDGKLTTTLDEDLPYDINSDKIVLEDKDYPIWYLDVFDGYEKYKGKTITFRAYVRDITEHTLVIGRQIMTCCEADIQFYGYECISDAIVKNNSYVEVTCQVTRNFSFIANDEVLMLKASRICVIPTTEEEKYLSFN